MKKDFNESVSVYGLKKFGYISNFNTQLAQLNYLLRGTGNNLKGHELDSIVDGLTATNLNRFGCDNYHGKPIEEQYACYKILRIGMRTLSGKEVVGLFTKNKKKNTYEGVVWTTKPDLQGEICLLQKPHMGDIYFATKQAFDTFLESVANNAIEEPWDFSGKGGYPILKSYIENTLRKLRQETAEGKEHKVVYSADGQHILFNTNLPDTFGYDILILADVRKKVNGEEYYENASMFKSGIAGKRQYRFADNADPQPATYFEDVNEVIFQSRWQIDSNFDHLTHIIQDNRSRFPEEYRGKNPSEVAGDLDKAIQLAQRMAKRNFKYIAPMYRPQKDGIQLLMPIYLKGQYKQAPDFALVLTPENGIYVPETILPISAAYQNARLIAMPDEAWLRPESILVKEEAAA